MKKKVKVSKNVHNGHSYGTYRDEGHGVFKFFLLLNMLADIAMCVFCAYKSQSFYISIGMAVLAAGFAVAVLAVLLLVFSMRSSSGALIDTGYTLLNACIGVVFAAEFWGAFPSSVQTVETAAVISAVLVVVIFVNIAVARGLNGEL